MKEQFKSTKPAAQEWELVNPEGVTLSEPVTLNPHPDTLEGKTVVLTWNHKPNGDVFLNRLAELLSREAKAGKIIKLWEEVPFTAVISKDFELSQRIAAAAAQYQPDIVINAQGD